jgi:hypothetical protein
MTHTNVYAQFSLNLNMDFLTEGLNMSGTMAYRTSSGNYLYVGQSFQRWIRTGTPDELEFEVYGTSTDTPLSYSKGLHFYYDLSYKGMMDYKRRFGRHDVAVFAFAFYQNLNTADTGSPGLLPYKRILSGAEAAYNYDGRYFLRYDLGYSGSEQYSRENRFTPVQSVSAAWALSGESFLNDAAWLSLLKLRAAYGQTANDRTGLGRYPYLDNISLKGGGALMNYLAYQVDEENVANPDIKPEIYLKQNYGIDLTLWNQFYLSADLFHEKTNSMVAGGTSTTPAYQGIPLSYFPVVNLGVFENSGYEISAGYAGDITPDFGINAGGWLAFTHNKNIYSDESERADDYVFRKRSEGYPAGQAWGYLVNDHNGNGFFNSEAELQENRLIYEIGTPRVGDLIYYDLNDDGYINEKDYAPLGLGSIPRYTYAFQLGARYGNFDFNALFQGVASFYTIYGVSEFNFEGMYYTMQKTAWTPERYANGEEITYPALAVKANSNHQSSNFFLEDRSYLRLKNVTLAYNFPQRIAKAIAAENIRLTLSGQNLLTWHRLKTTDYGPEGSYLDIPVYQFYNIGISIKF